MLTALFKIKELITEKPGLSLSRLFSLQIIFFSSKSKMPLITSLPKFGTAYETFPDSCVVNSQIPPSFLPLTFFVNVRGSMLHGYCLSIIHLSLRWDRKQDMSTRWRNQYYKFMKKWSHHKKLFNSFSIKWMLVSII